MDAKELLERLRGSETEDFEVKAAQGGLPVEGEDVACCSACGSVEWLCLPPYT